MDQYREILYRGKSIINNEWVYGDYLYKSNYRGYCHYSSIWDQTLYPSPIEVIQKTVGQYTNMNDHGDIKIFEGDRISSCLPDCIFIVVFHNGCFRVKSEDLELPSNMWGTLENFLQIEMNHDKVHVINSIHDNK